MNTGRNDALDIMYRFRKQKSALAIAAGVGRYRQHLNKNIDPTEAFQDLKIARARQQYSLSYFRLMPSKRHNHEWQIGLGFMVSGEYGEIPVYILRNGNILYDIYLNGTTTFWDPALCVNVNFVKPISKYWRLGANISSYYAHQIGVEGASLNLLLSYHLPAKRS